MKKILSLVVALVLVMAAVSALAEGSKTGADIPVATVANNNADAAEAVSLVIVDDTEESAALIKVFQDAFAAGDVLSPLPEDVRAQIPEEQKNINEMVTAQFVGDVDKLEGTLKVNLKLDTPYEKDQKVTVLFGKLGDPVAWKVFEAAGMEDGSIEFILPAGDVMEMGNDPFVLAVVSE